MLASEHWKDNPAPKCNTPQMKSALAKFAEQIAPQCAMPEIGFTIDGLSNMCSVSSMNNEYTEIENQLI